jgi:plastocyanin
MKATKFTVTVTAEVLSMDSVHALLMEANANIMHEFPNGSVTADDGDTVAWVTSKKEVEF